MTAIDGRNRRRWTTAIFAFVGVTAVGFQMRGALLPSLRDTFTVSPTLLGFVATAGTLGFMLAVLATGMIAGRIDVTRILFGSVAVVSVAIFAMGLAPIFPIYLATLFVRGVATGPFRALDRAVLSHLYPDSRARIFNLYALVWAVGAALGPLVVTGSLALGDWRYAYLALGCLLAPVAVLVYRLDAPSAVGTERVLTVEELRAVLRKPAISGMVATLVLSGGVEGSLFTWLPYFAASYLHIDDANLVLTTFLIAYVPARLFYSIVVERFRYSLDLVVVLAILGVPILWMLVTRVSGSGVFLVAFCLGFVVSGIFPTLSAFGVEAAPEYSGPVNALSTAASYTGIAVVPPVVGFLAERSDIQQALRLLPVLLLVFIVLAVVTRLRLDDAVSATVSES